MTADLHRMAHGLHNGVYLHGYPLMWWKYRMVVTHGLRFGNYCHINTPFAIYLLIELPTIITLN